MQVAVVNRIPKKLDEVRAQLARALRKTAQDFVDHAVEAMSGPKSGRLYRVGSVYGRTGRRAEAAYRAMGLRRGAKLDRQGRKRYVVGARVHQASAPGEAPARMTGFLAARMTQIEELDGGLMQIIPVPYYGEILEPLRPFLAPARDAALPPLERALRALKLSRV